MTGGNFADPRKPDGSPVYDFEIGSVLYRIGGVGSLGLALRRDKNYRGEETLQMAVDGGGIHTTFSSSDQITFGESSLTISSAENNSPSPKLTIKPGQITYSMPTNQKV